MKVQITYTEIQLVPPFVTRIDFDNKRRYVLENAYLVKKILEL